MFIKLRINKPLKNYRVGQVIRVKAIKTNDPDWDEYVPVDPYWKRRIKDSKLDNCVSIIYY